ncbi:MAG: hypothetical protein K2P63_08450 [Lachnospiraceae bacterium]|nr:hypothetical protein [Lachnospiraceae bacterium]
MNRDRNKIFLTVMFVVCILIQIDVNVFRINIKIALITVGVLIALSARLMTDRGFVEIKTDHIDRAVYLAGVLALAGMLSKVILDPQDYGKYMTLLSLCLLYFAARNYLQDISEDMLFLGSVLNAVPSILLLYHYFVDTDFQFPVSHLLQADAILPWLLLAVTVNVLGFCVDDGRQLWYGANAVVGFFLLFLQDNAAANVMAGAVFLQISLRYMTRRTTVRRVGLMFFAYALLLCNMALITNYTDILCEEAAAKVSYDLELSVYAELMLAVFGVWFFHTWDKCDGESDEEDNLLPQFRGFFKKAAIMVFIVFSTAASAGIRGGTDIVPDVFGKAAELVFQSLKTQRGILEMAAVLYGIPGVILTGYFLYGVLDVLRKNRLLKTSRHRKVFRIVSWVFAVQALFLTQSMASLPLYLIFVAVMLNERGDMETAVEALPDKRCASGRVAAEWPKEHEAEQKKGERANETDHSDSMLQRGRDPGGRAERTARKTRRHRPDRISDHQ